MMTPEEYITSIKSKHGISPKTKRTKGGVRSKSSFLSVSYVGDDSQLPDNADLFDPARGKLPSKSLGLGYWPAGDSFFNYYPYCKIPLNITGSQGDCSSCYAHAAATHLTHQMCQDTKKPAPKLSVQQIIDCGPGTGCAAGGNAIDIFIWLKTHAGYLNPRECNHPGGYVADKLVSPTNPSGANPTCDNTQCDGRAIATNTIVSDASYREDYWMDAMTTSTIVATMNLYADFEDYDALKVGAPLGVYTCPPDMSPTGLSHWVVLVGFGKAKETGLDFFIMENSWGNMYDDFDNGAHNPLGGLGPFARVSRSSCMGWGINGNIWGAGNGYATAAPIPPMKKVSQSTVTSMYSAKDVVAANAWKHLQDVQQNIPAQQTMQKFGVASTGSKKLPSGG